MEVVNDNSCSWVNDLSPRNNIVQIANMSNGFGITTQIVELKDF